MILELASVMVATYFPINYIQLMPTSGGTLSTYTALGLGINGRYILDPNAFISAEYEINFGARTKTTPLAGYGAGIGYYFLGSVGDSEKRSYMTSISSPTFSSFVKTGIMQRSYDNTTVGSKVQTAVTQAKYNIATTGNFWSPYIGVGFEALAVSERFRVGGELDISNSISASDSVTVRIFSLQLLAIYQL